MLAKLKTLITYQLLDLAMLKTLIELTRTSSMSPLALYGNLSRWRLLIGHTLSPSISIAIPRLNFTPRCIKQHD